jgi:hypothetical protein
VRGRCLRRWPAVPLAVVALLVASAAPVGAATLPDSRVWEMVSPIDKNGGQIDPPEALAGGGVLQAAADGEAVTYGSSASFGDEARGAPPASQYLSLRGAGGWATQNITVPLFSASYGFAGEGAPYRLFSSDLARGLLLNGRHCRGESGDCGVANPPLPGTGAPAGYQNYYLRDDLSGGFEALLDDSTAAGLRIDPTHFDLTFAGASAGLGHVVLSTCAALTTDAVETALGEGCDPTRQNLYEWSPAGLSLINLLPGEAQGSPGAELAAQAGAVSADGSRVYWSDGGNLYLRESGQTKQVDAGAGGGGAFETASIDGAVAFFTRAGHLYRWEASTAATTDLTLGGGVLGVLGASADGSYVYYLTAAGLFLRHGAATTEVAAAADAGDYPPATGTARVSADGTRLAFVSKASLTGYDNTDRVSGLPDSQVYLYDTSSGLLCASCRPSGTRPIGPSTIPGAIANGQGPAATVSYKPRILSAGSRRLFFDSRDALATIDTNKDTDVYQWEALGTGSCAKASGCIEPISSGRAEGGASFVDASSDGDDAFFLTDGSLVTADPGSVDLYDARVGGGFPDSPEPIPCQGNACQTLPPAPVDPSLTTVLPGLGNPAVHYAGGRCRKGRVKRHSKCVRKRRHRKAAHRRGRR